jgi:hypothetical protein
MYISRRGSLIKNIATAIVNGSITLVILLVAPLGLAAVIMNTLAVTAATFIVGIIFDSIAVWLLNASRQDYFDYPLESQPVHRLSQRRNQDMRRRKDWQ